MRCCASTGSEKEYGMMNSGLGVTLRIHAPYSLGTFVRICRDGGKKKTISLLLHEFQADRIREKDENEVRRKKKFRENVWG